MRIRTEKDDLGEKELPLEAYYGIHTLRGKENSQITKQSISRQMIKGLALVKKAAAKANADAGMFSADIAGAITLSCDELLNGRLHGQFITDVLQGGAGISMNMNANEVIANRANEMMGGKKGQYEHVDPFLHVNCCQSSNDVIPTAGKIACIRMTKKLLVELKKFQNTLNEKAKEFANVYKSGRTHLQSVLPITLGKEFEAYSYAIGKDSENIDYVLEHFYEINMGATAIGTGVNAHPKYVKKFIYHINKLTGENFKIARNLIYATNATNCFLALSGATKMLSVTLNKIANDLKLLSSDLIAEIILPQVQSGSSMSPLKNNPIIPELINQIAFFVFGADTTVTHAAEAGQLELNVFLPIILSSLFESLTLVRRGIRTFREKCLEGVSYNPAVCNKTKNNEAIHYTLLTPYIGYQRLYHIVEEAKQQKRDFLELIIEQKIMTSEQLKTILTHSNALEGGFASEELLHKNRK